jgi:hypothetical protein
MRIHIGFYEQRAISATAASAALQVTPAGTPRSLINGMSSPCRASSPSLGGSFTYWEAEAVWQQFYLLAGNSCSGDI